MKRRIMNAMCLYPHGSSYSQTCDTLRQYQSRDRYVPIFELFFFQSHPRFSIDEIETSDMSSVFMRRDYMGARCLEVLNSKFEAAQRAQRLSW